MEQGESAVEVTAEQFSLDLGMLSPVCSEDLLLVWIDFIVSLSVQHITVKIHAHTCIHMYTKPSQDNHPFSEIAQSQFKTKEKNVYLLLYNWQGHWCPQLCILCWVIWVAFPYLVYFHNVLLSLQRFRNRQKTLQNLSIASQLDSQKFR